MLSDLDALFLHQFSQILHLKGIESVTLKGIEWENEDLISKINATLFLYHYLCYLEISFFYFMRIFCHILVLAVEKQVI